MLSTQQIFWSIAIVSSLLLLILLVMTLLDIEGEQKKTAQETTPAPSWLDARLILLFVTLFGWGSVVGYYLDLSLQKNILYPTLFAFLLTFAPVLLSSLRKGRSFEITNDLKGAILHTGQVLKPIPPHRNGLGKVQLQLDHRRQRLEVDAVTAGQEIEPGAPVRVVDVIDNRILVVEPIYDEIPPDGGMIRMQE